MDTILRGVDDVEPTSDLGRILGALYIILDHEFTMPITPDKYSFRSIGYKG
jgi:hypothetical protein